MARSKASQSSARILYVCLIVNIRRRSDISHAKKPTPYVHPTNHPYGLMPH